MGSDSISFSAKRSERNSKSLENDSIDTLTIPQALRPDASYPLFNPDAVTSVFDFPEYVDALPPQKSRNVLRYETTEKESSDAIKSQLPEPPSPKEICKTSEKSRRRNVSTTD
ncbi:Protein of unknown function [Gryllus bimaculatus]|nr:Protein of unknown function [Gryllus bimaculatus]